MNSVRTYREAMAQFSRMKTLDLWYYAYEPDQLPGMSNANLRKRVMKRIEQEQVKSRGEELFPKLVEHKGDMPIIKDQLPTIFHAEGHPPGEVQQALKDAFASYRNTLATSYKSLARPL